jgi:hypothetical protein
MPVSFRPTPKTPENNLNRFWLYPQLLSGFLLLGGIIYSLTTIETNLSFSLLYGLSAGLAILHFFLFRPLLRPFFKPTKVH